MPRPDKRDQICARPREAFEEGGGGGFVYSDRTGV
jgi:hypothetical protein